MGLAFLSFRALRQPIALERTKAIATTASRKASNSIEELNEDRQYDVAEPTLRSPNLLFEQPQGGISLEASKPALERRNVERKNLAPLELKSALRDERVKRSSLA